MHQAQPSVKLTKRALKKLCVQIFVDFVMHPCDYHWINMLDLCVKCCVLPALLVPSPWECLPPSATVLFLPSHTLHFSSSIAHCRFPRWMRFSFLHSSFLKATAVIRIVMLAGENELIAIGCDGQAGAAALSLKHLLGIWPSACELCLFSGFILLKLFGTCIFFML